MALRSESSEQYLPSDFVSFIDKNYERIFDIREKIRDFHSRSLGKHDRRTRVLGRSFSSDTEEGSSDQDVVKVISAKVVPKHVRLDRFDRIELGSDYLEALERDSEEEEAQALESILLKFPLVSLSERYRGHNSSDFLLVEGRPVHLSERAKAVEGRISVRKGQKKMGGSRKRKKGGKELVGMNGRGDTFPSIHEIAWDIYTRYYDSVSAQLTLPPLHSSVLTLLGQRSPLKPSPRTGLSQGSSTSTSKQKKLRRHGRRRKSGSRAKGDITHSNAENQGNSVGERSGEAEGPGEAENELSALSMDRNEEGQRKDEDGKEQLYSMQKTRSLHLILDEKLERRPWHTNADVLEAEIKALEKELSRPEAKWRAGSMNLKEDLWLSFPRTWSHTSGTFWAPKDPQQLKHMSPMEYLQKYVRISEPRQHLYNLIFQRYRVRENPLGKTVPVQAVQRALAEVIGEPLESQRAEELFQTFLNFNLRSQDIDEAEFRGISALCERIYGNYSLEENKECHVCSKYPNKDKNRCHQNQRDNLEQADLEYLSSKIRGNQVEPHLARLLQAICNRELNFL